MDGGYDLTMYGLAGDGAVLAGHVTGVTDGRVTFADDVEETLHKADQAYDDFVTAARRAVSELESDLVPDDALPLTEPTGSLRTLDLKAESVGTVIWATGYEYAYEWMHLPVLDERGSPIQRRGITPERGLYFLGLHWMHTLRSGLLMGVGDDACFLGEHMERIRG